MTELTRFFESCFSALKWAAALVVVLAVTAVGFVYLQLDEELRQRCEQLLSDHYQELTVNVGGARLVRGEGLILSDVNLGQRATNLPSEPILTIDEIFVNFDAKVEELATKRPEIRQIVVKRPQLRARWLSTGKWNFEALFPFPRFGKNAPSVQIDDATLFVEDAEKNGPPLVVRNVAITLTPDSNPATATHGNPSTSNRTFRIVGVSGGSPAKQLRFSGTWDQETGQMAIEAQAEELEVSPELFATLPLFDASRLNDLEIEGRANLSVNLSRKAGPNAAVDWSASATLARGRINHASLPHPLTDVAIEAHCNASQLVIDRMVGKCGTSDVIVAVERHGWQPNAPIGVAGRAKGLTLDQQLFVILPESIRPIWLRFQPLGIVDVDFRGTYDGVAWRPEVTIGCRQLSLIDLKHFPYRVENCTGEMTIRPTAEPGRSELCLALVGAAQNHSIKIDAQVSGLSAAPEPAQGKLPLSGWIEVAGRDVPLHDELVAALPEGPEKIVRSLHAQGTCDFRWRLDATPSQPPQTAFQLQLKDCSIVYDHFPYPLQNINGSITAENKNWQLRDLTGRGANGSTQVRCEGRVVPAPSGYLLDLTFTGDHVPLDETLKSALSPPVQEAWTEIRPQGRLGFVANVRHQTGDPKPQVAVELRTQDRSVSFEPRMFPYRFDHAEGVAHMADGMVRLVDLRASHGVATYATQGFWRPRPDGGWELKLEKLQADHLTAAHDLVAALPPELQKFIDQMSPNGTFRMYDSTFLFARLGGSTGQLTTAWDMNLDCHQSDLKVGVPLEDVTGAVHLAGLNDGRQAYSYGDLRVDSLLWKGYQFTNVRGPLWIDRSEFLLGRPASAKRRQTPQPATAQIYGGSVVADANVRLAGLPRYSIEASLVQADLARVANERLGGRQDVTGTLAGHIVLGGTGFSTHAMTGEGELHVMDANMYRLPVLVALLKVLQIRAPDTTAFNRCDMNFSIEGEHIHFQQLNFLGDVVSFYGRGEANFDRDINLVFYSLMGSDNMPKPLSMLRSIVGQASEQMLQLKVDGTMDDPQIHRDAFPAVAQILEQIQSDLQTPTDQSSPPGGMPASQLPSTVR